MGVLDPLFGGKDTRKTDERVRSEALQKRVGLERSGTEEAQETKSLGLKTTNLNRQDQVDRGTQRQSQQQQTSNTQTQQQRQNQLNEQLQAKERSTQQQTGLRQQNQAEDINRQLQEFLSNLQTGRQTQQQQVVGQSQQQQTGQTVTENLDARSQETLANLLQTFGSKDSTLSQFVGQLQNRAAGAFDEIQSRNQRILEGARYEGQRDIATRERLLAQEAGGSTLNSLVQASAAELENDLEIRLAGLDAELSQRARDTQTQEYEQVLRGFGTQASGTQNIASSLLGARQTVQQQSDVIGQENRDVQSLLESLTQSEQKRQQEEDVLQQLQSYSQDQLTSLVDQVRQQSRDAATQEALLGQQQQQQQTATDEFVTELVNSLSTTTGEEVTSEQISQILERLVGTQTEDLLVTEEQQRRKGSEIGKSRGPLIAPISLF